MRFLLDQNVPKSVGDMLERRGHEVHLVRNVVFADSPDPLIATVSELNELILVSADHDFNDIAPRIPKGSRARFRKLSRISLACTEYQAAARMEEFLGYIEMEYARTQKQPDKRLLITIQNGGFKINR